jgi:hypothetical protein
MALLFIDGFEAADFSTKWNSFGSWGSNATTRFGSGRSISDGSGRNISRFITPSAQVTVGYAMTNNGGHSTSIGLYGDNSATIHIGLFHNPSTYLLELRRGANAQVGGGTLLATGTTQLYPNTWNYIEIQTTIADAGGVVTVRINGNTVPEISFTGDTRNAGTSTNIDFVQFNSSGFDGLGGTGNGYLDDVYILNSTGTTNNTFLGDVRVYSLAPSGNGTDSGLTGSDGNQVNNYLLVNSLPYQTTTYNGSLVTGTRDTYQMSDLAGTVSTVYGVQNNIVASKSDANTSLVKNALRLNGNLYYGSQVALNTNYQNYNALYDLNPDSGTPWTVTDVNNAEAGMEVF